MKTPIRYVATIIIQSAEVHACVIVCLCLILIPVAHCEFLIAFCADLKIELCMLNEMIKIESQRKQGFSTKSMNIIRIKFCKIVRFHCDAKQLSDNNFFISVSALNNILTIFSLRLELHLKLQKYTLESFR